MKEKTSITSSLSNKGSLTDAEINAGFGFNTILKSPDLNGQLYDIDSQVDIISKEICNFLINNGVTINSGDNSQLATLMSSLLSAKQNTLVAGTGITIDENGVISAQASTPANIPLFFYTWLDSLPFNVSWVNANNYSWLYGSTYVGAYNRLKSQLNPVGTFSAGDTYYVCNFSDGSMQTTTVLIGGATVAQLEAWCSAQGYTYSGATIEEFKCYKTVSASSEEIEGITITYYQTNDGKKIVTSDAEIANAESIYNATGVQWYYILDTTNQRFKLPRINPTKKDLITLMRGKGNGMAVGLTDGTYFAGLQRGNITNEENCLAAAGNGYGEAVGTANANRIGLKNNVLAGVTTDPTKSGIVIDPNDSDTVFAGSKYLYFYLGSADVEETAEIAGIKAETINNKADLDLSNVSGNIDFIIDSQKPTAENNYAWYNKYKSGWVEQGGVCNNYNYQTIILPVEMRDKNYSVQLTEKAINRTTIAEGTANSQVFYDSCTTTSLYVYINAVINTEAYWEVKGMSAN